MQRRRAGIGCEMLVRDAVELRRQGLTVEVIAQRLLTNHWRVCQALNFHERRAGRPTCPAGAFPLRIGRE
ncbi:MAG: hypothetical protein AB7F89_12400 [Pirellulaceae bacterium]